MSDTNNGATSNSTYPSAPVGSRAPPDEFISKMASIDHPDEQQSSNTADEQQQQFGMFDRPLFSYSDLPCSLHFYDTSNNSLPSSKARDAMKILHTHLLGNTFGAKQGKYGAGGGGIHILYLGLPTPAAPTNFPDIDALLKMLHLSDTYQPQSMQWMTTTDPIHQTLFPKYRDGGDEDDDNDETTLSLDDLMELLVPNNVTDASAATIPTRPILATVPSHVITNYPLLRHGRILFLIPRFASLHDGDCLYRYEKGDIEPTTPLCPTAVAFTNRRTAVNNDDDDDGEEYWYQFQHRPEHNVHVYLEQTTAAGPAKEAGDIDQAPVICLFQLESTGELMALVQWDYRD